MSKPSKDNLSGLVVGRKQGESIIIGGLIKIQVLRDEDNLIRLRIIAPKKVNILREEIFDESKVSDDALYKFLKSLS